MPGAVGAGVNFGLTAARTLEERKIDGFWANGMAAATAVGRGVGTVVLDVRRGDGPPACFDYTFASIAASDRLIEAMPALPATVRAVIDRTHDALRSDLGPATKVGQALFPPAEADWIAELIRRDLPYYSTEISRETVEGMNRFARDMGSLSGDVRFEDVVAA